MRYHHLQFVVMAFAMLSACASGATEGYERLPDGSFLRATSYKGGPLIEGTRCWKRSRNYDCLVLRRFEPPTFLVTRYATSNLDGVPYEGQHFGCLFEPTGDEWFRQVISRESVSKQPGEMLVRSVPRTGVQNEWSRAEAHRLLRENDAAASDFIDCRALQEVLVTSGVRGLLQSDLAVTRLLD